MASGRYPFIDIAVHDSIRTGYADGDAQVILSRNARDLIWANGAGARLFGYSDPYSLMDEGLSEGTATFRQIEAAIRSTDGIPGKPAHRFAMRAGSGIRRSVMPATMECMTLADGKRVFLLACKIETPATTAEARAANLLGGFEDTETLAAVIDGDGEIVDSTGSFKRLQLDNATRRSIVDDVARDSDRLVKHPVRTALGLLPAAIARIEDDPPLHLMFAVEMSIGNLDPDTGISPPAERDGQDLENEASSNEDATAGEPDPLLASPDEEHDTVPQTDSRPPPSETMPPEQSLGDFVFDPQRRPVRFVWRIDADGVFRELSGEFAEAVGPNAADVIGRRFADVALVLNIDSDHAIADLLQKRDTWSGKTVRWPVQGTDLIVPVDLAALPTYSRDRVFDGFRGFGIIRCSDASEDPERIGLALAGPSPKDRGVEPTHPDTPEPLEPEVEAEDSVARPQADFPSPKPEIVTEDDRTDKVIKLEERRPRPREGLSTAEQQALREIAERLNRSMEDDEGERAFGKRPNTELEGPKLDTEPELQDTGRQAEDQQDRLAETEPEVSVEPAGRKTNAAELEALEYPVVIHDGATVFHANDALLSGTGYAGVEEINAAGGLYALVGTQEDEADTGPMLLRGTDEFAKPVSARLRSVVWEGRKALLLDFMPVSTQTRSVEADDLPAEVTDEPAPETPDDEDDSRRIAELQVEVQELRSILETATDGVVLLDHDGRIRSLNRSALALFDFDDAEARDKPFAFLFAHESQRAVQDYLTGLSEHGVASVLNDGREVIGREASGRFIPLFMTIGRLSGSNGFCAVMRDITHWKRTEEELRTAKRSAEAASLHKTEFLARVSHEIRTPLNAIIGFSDLMAEERFGPIGSPRYVEYAGDIGRSGRHVLDIVNDLLDISKIEAGEQDLDFQSISLNQMLLDAVTILQPQANSQRVIIRTSLSSQLPNVVADPRSFKQIAINILSNAVRFTPVGGQAVVSSSYEKDGSAVVRIRDTGVGMTQHQLDEAMKPFRQVTASPRPRGEGTGLGLPLAKAMAEANRAEFSMDSEPGRGTLVEIRFPPQRVLAE